jgi:hypothetical protein
LWPKCDRLLRVERPWGTVYVVPVRWVVMYEYEVPGGDLNLNSTKLPRPWSLWGSSASRKNPHGRTGNRTQEDLLISSQKLWPLDHEAGQNPNVALSIVILLVIDSIMALRWAHTVF